MQHASFALRLARPEGSFQFLFSCGRSKRVSTQLYLCARSQRLSAQTQQHRRAAYQTLQCEYTNYVPRSAHAIGRDNSVLTRSSSSSGGGGGSGGGGATEHQPAAAYVHLPFCKRKCFYCDFPVQVLGRDATSSATEVPSAMRAYVDTLCQEIAATQNASSRPLTTVFFGGGTPSLVPPMLLQRITDLLKDRFGIAVKAEISMEADPGTFDAARLREYMALGVNRFSIGVQAFQEDLLRACGRSHGVADVRASLEAIREAAPPSWSLDLISGVPHLTPRTWERSLREAVTAEPDHISVYDLQVEANTPFGRWYQPEAAPLPGEDDAVEMWRAASRVLRGAGYEHYELSNYAKPGHRCRHNMVYWEGKPYHAFGLGAASYVGGRRFTRPRKMAAYREWVAAFAADGEGVPGLHVEPVESRMDRLQDAVMLRLRLTDGLDLRRVSGEHGAAAASAIAAALQAHRQRGSVSLEGAEGEDLPWVARLTDPEGLLLSNDVISDVFAALEGANTPHGRK